MKQIYLNPTIRQLSAALGDVVPVATEHDPGHNPAGAVRGSSVGYTMTGLAQLLAFLVETYIASLALSYGYDWLARVPSTAGASGLVEIFARAAALTAAAFITLALLPVIAKWVLIGRWKRQRIRLWSLGYIRFWLVRQLIQTNPMALFAGSPLFVIYMRLLGAKIGPNVTIHSASIPIATDLLTIDEGAVIRKNAMLNGYRALDGAIEIGAISIGRYAHIGEKTVLDIDTEMGDGAELGHSSSLHTGQCIPAGQTWHGCPAEPAFADYRTCPPALCGRTRKIVYSILQLAFTIAGGALAATVGVVVIQRFPQLDTLLDTGATAAPAGSYLTVVWASALVFIGAIVIGLAVVITVPRALHRLFITPSKVYPLYGFRHVVQDAIAAMTNVTFFMDLFGDTSAVVHYLRAIGYRLGTIIQTGSNFGATQRQDSPYLTTIGTGTMVSDALSIMNTDYSGSSFRVLPVTIGADNYFGNDIAYPAASRTGDNVLLATKVMVPIDGPVRENCGLLGSPPFEIPRSVMRDADADRFSDPEVRRARVRAKNWHNLVTATLFLLVRYTQILGLLLIGGCAIQSFPGLPAVGVFIEVVFSVVYLQLTQILAERLTRGFRRLTPRECSIYDHYFWTHERMWKLLSVPIFNGTPYKNILWRLAGVRMGKRVFDDGCSMAEKTLVTIGDDCALNAQSTVQCHSLEDGKFKSDHIVIGSGVTLGVHAFVHYGAHVGDAAVLDTNSFLMKGEHVNPGVFWSGNPASEVRPRPGAPRES